ncbi:hypothetical protein pEaSNUABM42_00208 [Erwinia phage pEa_SNUABM_42]|nr:hypothetical protein pEaSNUABM43_00209 [Erwinia phage pEa_SNUABM_43]QVW55525.1 hypothetical protein pEaSNUABM42_00208 [Erwinia phage pEa_SNUABM_42]
MPQFRREGFVEAPRKWNPKSLVAICVESAMKWPQTLRTEAEFIADRPQPSSDSVLNGVVRTTIIATVEKELQSVWRGITGHAHLPR